MIATIYILEKANYGHSKKISGCHGLEDREECLLEDSEITVYDAVMTNTCHIFVQTHRLYTKNEP